MHRDDSSLKVFVFIARDDDEFNRYDLVSNNGNDEFNFFEPINCTNHTGFSGRFNRRSNLVRLVINKGSIRLPQEKPNYAWNILRPRELNADWSDTNLLAVLLDECKKNQDECKNDQVDRIKRGIKAKVGKLLVKTVAQSNEAYGNLITFLKEQLKIYGIVINAQSSCEYYVFIHWGGGDRNDILQYEKIVTSFLPQNWKLYSLGTFRNNLFSVDRDIIEVPCDLKELQELEKSFADEAGFELVKSVMTRYVVANENRNKTSQTDTKNVDYFSINNDEMKNLRSYLQSIRASEVLPKKWKLWDASDITSFLDGENASKLPYSEDIVALFSKLIREGVRND